MMTPHATTIPVSRRQLQQSIEALIGRMLLDMRPQISEDSSLMELTMSQLRTLVLLHSLGPLRMSDLAARLGIGMPTATSLVTKLEEKRLAARAHDTQDRRVVLCSASDLGRQEAERFWRVKRERMDQITARLSDDDLALVARVLELVVNAAGACQTLPPTDLAPVARPSAGVQRAASPEPALSEAEGPGELGVSPDSNPPPRKGRGHGGWLNSS